MNQSICLKVLSKAMVELDDHYCDEIYQNYYSVCEEDCKTFREIREKVGDDRCSEIDGCYENHMNILNELNSKHQTTMYHYVFKRIRVKNYHEDTDSEYSDSKMKRQNETKNDN